jgi:hypothetical protein
LIRPKPSVYLATLLAGAHLCAIAQLPLLNLGLGIKLIFAGLIAFSLTYFLRIHLFQKGRKAVSEFSWQSAGIIKIKDGHGHECIVELGDGIFVRPRLVILNLCESDGYRRALLLFTDSADPESLRRLRSRLLLTTGEVQNSV